MKHKQIIDYWQIPKDWPVLYRAIGYTEEGGGTVIGFHEYPIVKYTACGVWISNFGHERFVNLKGVKSFACLSKEEAVRHLYFRKRRQVQIITYQLKEAETILNMIERKEY